jgi:hypothetical protein
MTAVQLKKKATALPSRREPIERALLTPERAMELLEHNTLNRPLSQPHVNRIAQQILTGAWRFNGDTIKVGANGDVVDGQHRLWAIVESKTAVETIVVYDVPRDAFATIDTLRKPRNGADILALNGVGDYRREAANALGWLVRWQRGNLTPNGSSGRVENSDIEGAYAENPAIVEACARAKRAVHGFASPGMFGFLYYIFTNRNSDIADRMINTLENPAGIPLNDPFFKLRAYLINNKLRRREPLVTIALAIKAANAARAGKRIDNLAWKNQGEKPEPFPVLKID